MNLKYWYDIIFDDDILKKNIEKIIYYIDLG
jgi:hypothetical protein